MKVIFCLIFIFSVFQYPKVFSQPTDSTEVFLLTCFPGKTVETIYGHSAVRIVNHSQGIDKVYSWGVYDPRTRFFVYKFAAGRLKYQIDGISFKRFLYGYFMEGRSVISQKINFNESEIKYLIELIDKNLQPEYRYYLYDFFYDNCATRVRDIIEKTLGNKLKYPNTSLSDTISFRQMINKAEKPMPWYLFGTDFLIGKPGDKTAGFRDQMFLPENLMSNLSLTSINRNGIKQHLLQNPVTLLSFEKDVNNKYFLNPLNLFIALLVFTILITFTIRNPEINLWLDRIYFLAFAILAIFMIYFNFITDHHATRMNLNIIWLNPILILAFITLFLKKIHSTWFKIIVLTSVVFLIILPFMPQSINIANMPLLTILVVRSYARSGMKFLNSIK